MEQVKIGQITNAVGIKGELRVYPYVEEPQRFSELEKIYVEKKIHTVAGVRYMKNLVVLRLEGIDTRNEAEAQKGKNLYIDKQDLWEMDEDTYLVEDLVGTSIFAEDGVFVGTLVRIIHNSRQDLYEIEMENGKHFLLPAVKEFILRVDTEAKRMTVKLIEGLVEL